jgi:hypothetical protein
MSSKLEFKIIKDNKGNNIDLNNMSLASTQAFLTLLQSLTNIVNVKSPKDVNIRILKGSAVLVAEGDDAVIAGIEQDFDDVLNRKSAKRYVVENWREIQNLLKDDGLQYEANFHRGSQKRSLVEPIKSHPKFRVRSPKGAKFSISFIKGKLIEVGGLHPNIHISSASETYTVACTEQEAIDVNKFLYNNVMISTWQKKRHGKPASYTFCDHYVIESHYTKLESFFKKFQDKDDIKKLELVHDEFRKYVLENSLGVAAKLIRVFNNESFDISTLKTALVVTKSFKDSEVLREIREAIKAKLESKVGPLV